MGDEPPHLFSGHTVFPEPDFHRLDRASFAWRAQTASKAFFWHCHEMKELLAAGGTWDTNTPECPNMSEAIRTQA